MNTDIRIACDCPDHPKVEKLCRRCGETAFRCLIRFWCFVAVNHPSGLLNSMDDEDIEIAAGWRGEQGVLLKALLEVKLIEKSNMGYFVHEWEFHQTYVISAPDRKIRGIKGNAASQVARGIMTEEEAKRYIKKKIEIIKSATSTTTSALEAQLNSTNSTTTSVTPSPAPSPAPSPSPKTMSAKKADADETDRIPAPRRVITDKYQNRYIERYGKKPTWGKKEGKHIRELLMRFEGDATRIAQLIDLAFDSDDKFIQSICGSFLTLTAAANITRLDAMDIPEHSQSMGSEGFCISTEEWNDERKDK